MVYLSLRNTTLNIRVRPPNSFLFVVSQKPIDSSPVNMAPTMSHFRKTWVLPLCLSLLAGLVLAHQHHHHGKEGAGAAVDVESMSLEDLDERLQVRRFACHLSVNSKRMPRD